MDYNQLLSIKNMDECKKLPSNFISTGKKHKKQIKTKEKININNTENKVMFILNKLGNNNIEKIVGEYIENINIKTQDELNLIYDLIYKKMNSDVIFANDYVLFLLYVIKIHNHRHNYIDINYFLNKLNDIHITNITIIYYMVKYNLLTKNIIDDIYLYLYNNKKYEELYHFVKLFELRDKYDLLKKEIVNITNNRIKLMFDVLFENKEDNKNITKKESIKTDEFKNLVYNLMEEYLYLNSMDEVIYYMDNELKKSEYKSFITHINNYYSETKNKQILKLLNFINKSNSKIVFK